MDEFAYISDAILARWILETEVEPQTPEEVVQNNWADKYAPSKKWILTFLKDHPNYVEEDYRFRQLERFVELHPEVGEQRDRLEFVEKFVKGELGGEG